MSHFIELSHPWQHPTQNRSCHQTPAAKIVIFSYFIQNTKCTHNVFQSIYVKKDTTDSVWSCLHKSCKQRPKPRVTEVALAGECTGCVMAFPSCFCTAKAVWRKVIINNFFFQSGTHTHPGTGFCTQPTQIFAIQQGICKIMYCLMYIHIHYSRRQFPACRCPKGSIRIIHLLTIQGPASVPLSMLWVTMHLSAPSKSWRCQPTPISKDKSFLQVSHESSKCGAPRHAVGVWGGLSSLDSQPSPLSCTPSKGPPTPYAVMVKGNTTLVNSSGRNRRSPGDPPQPSAWLALIVHLCLSLEDVNAASSDYQCS